ncbi:MAG: thioredoxin domain-containing protein [Gemmatimonadetes bacterium]|nr:thioredoxin domain-containing protein [Gemmatimonadota bacterium]MBT7863778.1 thioredoxin domain-containing protein [Gemmatimonadota bacterium]
MGTVVGLIFAGSQAWAEVEAPANRLAHEASPYLQLHAHNPVDWYPWGPEALARARDEDKPIFLSVGYSTCYWCHVMERLVFSDLEIAAQMNRDFINIKVDREERPDIDRLYMTATQLMTGRGGWPNSVFLTPDLRPFFAGTYYPPEDLPGRAGFPRVLRGISTAWSDRRNEVEDVATRLQSEIAAIQSGHAGAAPDSQLVARAVGQIKGRFDATNGGFGSAPKFPPAITLEFLLDEIEVRDDPETRRIVKATLNAMARGGIRDHVGGGFHRYATDARWRVPHFEKMLYNQAQLARLYARAAVVMDEPEWRPVAREILDFVAAELTSPEGGFYTALDAEVDGTEGSSYTWTESQLDSTLGTEAATALLQVFDLEEVPEGDGGHALFLRPSDGLSPADDLANGTTVVNRALGLLRAVRALREQPRRDDKVLTAWNGMMIAAAADVGRWLEDDEAVEMARHAADFTWSNLRTKDGRLWRSWRAGQAYQPGFLEDYAHLVVGYLAVSRATGDITWRQRARELLHVAIDDFGDPVAGGFYNTRPDPGLIVRSKSATDGALPSANAVLAHALLDLGVAEADDDLQWRARRVFAAFGDDLRQHPSAYTHLIAAIGRMMKGTSTAVSASPGRPLVQGDLTIEPQPQKVGESMVVTLHLQIEDGWHINAHPAAAGLLPTTMSLWSHEGELEVDEVTYPSGESHVIAEVEDTLSVWTGSVVLSAGCRVSTAGAGELVALIDYQACDESRCLAPAQLAVRAALMVEP